MHSRKKLGNAPARFQLFRDIIKRPKAVTVSCHRGKMFTRRHNEWRVTNVAKDLDFAAVIFNESLKSFRRNLQYNPYFFNITTPYDQDPGKLVSMFGYPATRKGLTFLFGQEQSRDDRNMIKLLKDEISSSRGGKRNDLIRFEKALKHIILYDTPTQKGSSGSPVLNHKCEVKAVHTRASPRPFNVKQGTSFAVIANVLERALFLQN